MAKNEKNAITSRRFSGTRRAYGDQAFLRLVKAHVCVIGLGGTGSWAVEALARSGIGKLTLIDLDIIVESNINRQLHALDETLGMAKVEALKSRCLAINPNCEITIQEQFLSIDNISNLIDNDFNYVLDCVDDFRIKAALTAYCKRNKIKLLVCGGAGGQVNPLKIKISDLSRSENDPLLAQVRRNLRQDYGFTKNLKRRFDVPCIYSDEQLAYPALNGEITKTKANTNTTTGLSCATGLGSVVTVTASFGMIAASYILNKIAQQTASLLR